MRKFGHASKSDPAVFASDVYRKRLSHSVAQVAAAIRLAKRDLCTYRPVAPDTATVYLSIFEGHEGKLRVLEVSGPEAVKDLGELLSLILESHQSFIQAAQHEIKV